CNIGPKEIQKRLRMGIFALAFSVLLTVLFAFVDEPNAAYGLLFLLLFFATLGISQAFFCT
ncbi:MAG TPA: hypothetical protein VFR89_02305, partial [candidate division Zixibacteria bacterium]|nr:hypothetical protein [candidate division Zixibacteria bacterium]